MRAQKLLLPPPPPWPPSLLPRAAAVAAAVAAVIPTWVPPALWRLHVVWHPSHDIRGSHIIMVQQRTPSSRSAAVGVPFHISRKLFRRRLDPCAQVCYRRARAARRFERLVPAAAHPPAPRSERIAYLFLIDGEEKEAWS